LNTLKNFDNLKEKFFSIFCVEKNEKERNIY